MHTGKEIPMTKTYVLMKYGMGHWVWPQINVPGKMDMAVVTYIVNNTPKDWRPLNEILQL